MILSYFSHRRRKAPSTFTPVRRKPKIDFSVTGLVFCSMMMFMGVAAMNTQANLLFGVFGLMIGVLLVSWGISHLVLRRLNVQRVAPDAAIVGQPATVTYEFTNNKRIWPSLSVSIAELDGTEAFTRQAFCYMLHAAPGMTATVPIQLTPKRRGLHYLGRYQLATSFPFGFIKRAVLGRQNQSILVYPALAEVNSDVLSLCRSADKIVPVMRPNQGGTDEFYGVKQFRPGNNPRHIYWRRSARTGVLVTREMTQVSPPRLVLLVDTFLSDRNDQTHAAVEKTISMAASLADFALEQSLLVGLCAWAEGWITVMPHRGKRQRRDLMAILARLPLNIIHNTYDLLEAAQAIIDPSITPVLFTPTSANAPAQSRRGPMVIAADASPYFRFPPGLDFSLCIPTDQDPTNVRQPTRWPIPGIRFMRQALAEVQ